MPLDALVPTLGRDAARRVLASAFRSAGIDSADLDARLLLCAATGIDHAELIRAPEVALGGAATRLADYGARRLGREPISRILGVREFWGVSFAVSPAVLDPRPETEGLVGSVLDAIGIRRHEGLAILDLGVGSGAILGALLLELPSAIGIGLDRSGEACRVANRNLAALALGRRAAILCGDWAAIPLAHRFDVVVANPPYIASGDLAALAPDVRDFDPMLALDGGLDGLDAYRAIVPVLPELLLPHGILAFECGEGQGESILSLIHEAGFSGTGVYKDLAGKDRVVMAQNVI